MADVRLSNSSVSSSAIVCQGATLSYGWKNLINTPTNPGIYTGSDANSEVQFIGWENPVISVRGYLLEDGTDTIKFNTLKQFAKSTASTYLYDDIVSSSGTRVAILSFDINRRAQDKDDNIYDYSIKLVETT